jgi:hypothetical protein
LARKATLEECVGDGGVVVVIDREHENDANTGAHQDALQRTLPASLVAAETAHGACVVLVFQRSSSMDGKKGTGKAGGP